MTSTLILCFSGTSLIMVQAKSFRLLSPTEEDARLVQLVAAHAGLSDCLTVIGDQKELLLVDHNGQSLMGSNTICKHLASATSVGKKLLGQSPEEEALVSSWRFSTLLV